MKLKAEGDVNEGPAQGSPALKRGAVPQARMFKKLRMKFAALNVATVGVVLTVVFTAMVAFDWQKGKDDAAHGLSRSLEMAEKAVFADGDKVPQIGAAQGAASEESQFPVAAYFVRVAEDGSTQASFVSSVSGATLDESTLSEALKESSIAGLVAQVANQEQQAEAVASPQENQGQDASESADQPGFASLEGAGEQASNVETELSGDSGQDLAAAQDSSDEAGAVTPQGGTLQDGPAAESYVQGSVDSAGLLYAASAAPAGVYVVFASASIANSWQQLALTLAGTGLAVLACIFVLSWVFSRWALRPAEEAWSRQQDFVADASHELKTPLTIILANMSILAKHPEASVASQSRWIESTAQEAKSMQGLVGDMLQLARMDAEEGAVQPVRETVDVSDLLEMELLQFESRMFERHVSFVYEMDDGVRVRGDRAQLLRLVGTLVDNACKYVDESGKVSVSLSSEGSAGKGQAVLRVQNSGTAIPAEDLPHVFDRFYRASKARTRGEATSGAGLGLAIAQEIAVSHGGSIQVASSEDEGTTFTVRLPLAE